MNTYQKLRNPEEMPPGGFQYFQAETETWLNTASLGELFARVKAHRHANNIPIPLLIEQEIETQLCSLLPPEYCYHCDPTYRPPPSTFFLRPTVEKAVQLTLLFGQRLAGEKHVSQEQAERQAATCVKCHFNQKPEGCTSCNSSLLIKAIQMVMGTSRRSTSYDQKLQFCAFCGCGLKAKVHFSPEAIRKGANYLERLPDWCWIKNSSGDKHLQHER